MARSELRTRQFQLPDRMRSGLVPASRLWILALKLTSPVRNTDATLSRASADPEDPDPEQHKPHQSCEDVGRRQGQQFGARRRRPEFTECRTSSDEDVIAPGQQEDDQTLELLGEQFLRSTDTEREPPVGRCIAHGRQQQCQEVGLLGAEGTLRTR